MGDGLERAVRVEMKVMDSVRLSVNRKLENAILKTGLEGERFFNFQK